ncbi:MAG: hypothetical protein HC904_01985 [Blastochloris sp.]|nr:hypothetical protein [Blastochloris sp.]
MCHWVSLFCSFLLFALPPTGFADTVADQLPKMVGKSAKELEKEHGATLKFLTKATDGSFLDPLPVPWHVWKLDTPETRYVVFSGQTIVIIPGYSSASILLVSESGEEIGSWKFLTGWRINIQSASTSYDHKLEAQIITVSTARAINGRDVAKQYFALVDDKLYFIRMEDSHGKLIRNHYLYSNHTLGGDLPVSDLTAWSAMLESRKLPLRLAALTYLSGEHINPDKPGADMPSERVEGARLARAFRAADSTKRHITDYRKSDNAWLKEAADLAATPLDESH